MHWYWLHHLINHFAADFCAHNIDLRAIGFSYFKESNPVAISHLAAESKGDFIIKSKTMSNLVKEEIFNIMNLSHHRYVH